MSDPPDAEPSRDLPSRFETGGIQLRILDEPHDAQVWVSLDGYDIPAAAESFCWAGGDTRAEAIAGAVRLFRECIRWLEAQADPDEAAPVPASPAGGTLIDAEDWDWALSRVTSMCRECRLY